MGIAQLLDDGGGDAWLDKAIIPLSEAQRKTELMSGKTGFQHQLVGTLQQA